MKKIKSFLFAAVAIALTAPVFTSCGNDDKKVETVEKIVENMVSEYTYNDNMVAETKAKSGKKEAILLIAFGSTWNNAFLAFDKTVEAYKTAFPQADVYMSFSSDICINRAAIGENTDDNGNIVSRQYYEPRYLLHAIGNAKYDKIYVQSLQVIPGEEFAAVLASVKKFMNNGYIASAHLDDAYLKKLQDDEAIMFGMPLLYDPDVDVPAVAAELNSFYGNEAQNGLVAFMGHGNPNNYDTFKANVRYTELEDALQALNPKFYVGTVDMPDNYKQDVEARMKTDGFNNGKVYLHALMSIAGDHAHNDMAGGYDGTEGYWNATDPTSEKNSWYEYFKHNGYQSVVPVVNNHPLGLLEIEGVRNIWIDHTKNAAFFEDAYHSMYPEE